MESAERDRRVADSYDAVAQAYAASVAGVDRKPLDLAFLHQFVQRLGRRGPVFDIGCGPGDVTRYLHDAGVEVEGIDISAAMIAEARRAHPQVAFSVGGFADLGERPKAPAGIVAFYSLIHLPPSDLQEAFHRFRRNLQPDGLLLVAFHVGDGATQVDEWFGKPVSLTGYFFSPAQLSEMLKEAGFTIDSTLIRPPYPEMEFPSERIYLLARSEA